MMDKGRNNLGIWMENINVSLESYLKLIVLMNSIIGRYGAAIGDWGCYTVKELILYEQIKY